MTAVLVQRVVARELCRGRWSASAWIHRTRRGLSGLLKAIERSPNTVRAAYRSSLRLWFEDLAGRNSRWDGVRLNGAGGFAPWLRAPAEAVVVIDVGAAGQLLGVTLA